MNKTYTVIIGDKTKTNVSATVAATDEMLRNQLKGDYADPEKVYIDRQFDAKTGIETITLHQMEKAQIVVAGDTRPATIKDALSDEAITGIARGASITGNLTIQRVVVAGVLTVTVSTPGAQSEEAEQNPTMAEDDPFATLPNADMPVGAMPDAKVTVQLYGKAIPVSAKDAQTDAALCRALEKDFSILKDPGAVEVKRDDQTGGITIVPKQVERYVAIVEGAEPVEIDAAIAIDDDHVLELLRPHFEGIAGALVKRKFVKGTVEIRFTKQGGPKGVAKSIAIEDAGGEQTHMMSPGQAWQHLVQCKPHVNPMIAVWREIERQRSEAQLDLYTLMLTRSAIQRALKVGPQEMDWVKRGYDGLVSAPAIPCRDVPMGF